MTLSLPGEQLLSITQPAIDVFLASKNNSGQINGLTYWQVANGYTAIALHDSWSKTTSNADTLGDLVARVEAHQPDCINEFNDDSMWWAVCLLEMYDLTGDQQHLLEADKIWTHVQQYVIPAGRYVVDGVDMAGGVMWTNKPNETQANAITAGLFSELSARLACHLQTAPTRSALLDGAMNSLAWILRCRFNSSEYLVLDHVDVSTGDKTDWTFTYNTGQAIAASLAIYAALQQQAHRPPLHAHSCDAATYLDLACNMARHALTHGTWVDADGTLTERGAYPGTGAHPLPAWQNNDAVGFKAILLRCLARLYRVLCREGVEADLQTQLAAFVIVQFHSLRDRDTNGHNQYGPWWAGPMDLPTSHSQLAALDVMAAVHAVQ